MKVSHKSRPGIVGDLPSTSIVWTPRQPRPCKSRNPRHHYRLRSDGWVTRQEAATALNVEPGHLLSRYRSRCEDWPLKAFLEPITEYVYRYDFEAEGFDWEEYSPIEGYDKPRMTADSFYRGVNDVANVWRSGRKYTTLLGRDMYGTQQDNALKGRHQATGIKTAVRLEQESPIGSEQAYYDREEQRFREKLYDPGLEPRSRVAMVVSPERWHVPTLRLLQKMGGEAKSNASKKRAASQPRKGGRFVKKVA